MDIDIITRVFIKKSTSQMRERPQLKVLMQACENSFLYSLYLLVKNFEEEIQLSGDRLDTSRRYTLE